MNKVEIKKAVGVIQNELTKYGLMTPGKGIDFKVSIMVINQQNKFGRTVPHMVAKWSETELTQDGLIEVITDKVEEMNRYFNAELFAHGITQREAWIKADHTDRVAYLEENPFGHPALYRVWAESRHVAA